MKTALIVLLQLMVASHVGAAVKAAKGPSDPQIAQIVVTSNKVDIEAGQLALGKTQDVEVKKFAQQMIDDHSSVNKSATELVQKLKVTPEDSDTSKGLQKGGDTNLAKLKGMQGKAFDKAYVNHEVTYHETVLNTIDKVLIPSSQNAELKALLEKVRPAIAAHLEHARHLKTAMK